MLEMFAITLTQLLILWSLLICCNCQLIKPKTIVVPMVVNLGGKVVPLGDVCTVPMEMFLNKFNKQTQFLPDYNLVAEISDDECSGDAAVKNFIPEYIDWKSHVDLSDIGNSNGSSKKVYVPRNVTFQHGNATSAIRVPYFSGPLCSGACQAISRYAQYFNVIETSFACVTPAVDNRDVYPNFYRLIQGKKDSAYGNIAFAKHMNWTKIAIISDTTQFTYEEGVALMELASRSNITVVAEEFFTGDADIAVALLKKADVRVIYALCYVHNCPKIACEAYKQGLYGPNVVWIFALSMDFTLDELRRPDGCTKEMTDEFARSTVMIGPDTDGYLVPDNFKDEMGHTSGEIRKHLRNQRPELANKVYFSWHSSCYEMAQHSAFVIAGVENKLQGQGETLSDVIGDVSRAEELEEMFRKSVLDLNIRASWGFSRQSQLSSPIHYRHSAPGFIVIQGRPDLTRKIVFRVDDGNSLHRFNNTDMIWRTSDGNPPHSEMMVQVIRHSVAWPAVIVVKIIAALILVAISLTIAFLAKWRNCQGVEDSFKRMTFGAFFGCLLGLVAIFTYPISEGNMDPFCRFAPALVAFSLVLVTSCLAVKILLKFFCKNHKSSIKNNPNLKTNSIVLVLVVLATILALVIINATGPNEIQPKIVQHSITNEVDRVGIVSKVTMTEFETCDTPNFVLGWIFLTLDFTIAISTVLASITLRKRTFGPYMSDFELSTILFYLLFPVVFVLFLILVIFQGKMVQFVVLVFFSFFQSVVLLGGFWWWKLGNHFNQPETNWENSQFAKYGKKAGKKAGKKVVFPMDDKNSRLKKTCVKSHNVLEIPSVSSAQC